MTRQKKETCYNQDMPKSQFVEAYKRGWYNHGQLMGDYLWDIEFEHFIGDLSAAEEIAAKMYARKFPKRVQT